MRMEGPSGGALSFEWKRNRERRTKDRDIMLVERGHRYLEKLLEWSCCTMVVQVHELKAWGGCSAEETKQALEGCMNVEAKR